MMRPTRKVLLCGFIVVLALGGPLPAGEASAGSGRNWPQYGGPKRNGVSDETGWKVGWSAGAGPKVLWTAEVGGGFSSLAVVGGRVYTLGTGGEGTGRRKAGPSAVVCVNAADGQIVWRKPLGGGDPAGTPAVDGGSVFAVARDGTVGCLDAADGNIRWQTSLKGDHGVQFGGWQIACSPLLFDAKTIVLDAGKVIALDRQTGKAVWSAGGSKAGYSSAVPFQLGGKTYVTTFNGAGLGVVDAVAGKEVASAGWKTGFDVNAALPMIDGEHIFICSGYGRGASLYRFDGSQLAQIYDRKVLRSHCNGPVLIGGHLYGLDGQGGSNGSLQCVEMKSGQVKWSAPMKCGAMIAAGDKLIVQAADGELVIAEASPAAYKELARARVLTGQCWTAPAIADGRIYCRSHAGTLVCLDPAQAGDGKPAGAAPGKAGPARSDRPAKRAKAPARPPLPPMGGLE